MTRLAALLLISIPLFAQTAPVVVPDPPACLTAPVTKGSVTISCALIDATSVNGASAIGAPQMGDGAFLQVRLSSTDSEVVGFRVGVSYLYPVPAEGAVPSRFVAWGTVGKTTSITGQSVAASYRYTFVLASSAITSIEVQELKGSGSQVF